MTRSHAELQKGWSEENAAAFKSSLEQHTVPRIGNERVDHIEAAHIIAALAPIWTEKPELARKLRSRLLQVLSFSKARGWRTAPLPEQRELKDGLAMQPRRGTFAAMPYADVPAFFADQLQKDETAGPLALLFTIATAARSGEVRQAEWAQIAVEARTWTRPAQMMKARDKHVVTLSEAAVALLKRAEQLFGRGRLVFPGSRRDSQLSDMKLSKVLRSAKQTATVHGFRSSFRDWTAEKMPTGPGEQIGLDAHDSSASKQVSAEPAPPAAQAAGAAGAECSPMNAPARTKPLDDIEIILPGCEGEEYDARAKLRSYRNAAQAMIANTGSDTARQLAWLVVEYATPNLYAPAPLKWLTELNRFAHRLMLTAIQVEDIDNIGSGG